MESNEETTRKFSALNEVKLSAGDKADILQTLRTEMNSTKPRRKFNRGAISGYAAAAAAVAIVAGGFAYEMHQSAIPSPSNPVTAAHNRSGIQKTSQDHFNYADEIAVIKSKGYSVTTKQPNASVKTASGATLSAWIGLATQSDGHNQYVFFFLNDKYLGTGAKTPSIEITSAKAAGDGIAVTYPVYKAHDSNADPTGTPVTITYTWNGSKLVPNKPYPKQFQASGSTSQNPISTKSYATSAEAANQIANIQGSSPSGIPVNLGYGITAKESAAMGHARYAWTEGNWTIEIRYYTKNTGAKQVAEAVVAYLHTHMLPAPNQHGVIVVNSMNANTTSFNPQTIIAWQEGTKVNELQQTGDPVQALQTVVSHK